MRRLLLAIAAATFIVSLWLILIFALAHPARAAETYGPYPARLSRVIDGDTVQVEIEIWPNLTEHTSVRLAGVNTPEVHGAGIAECEKQKGLAAADFTAKFLLAGSAIVLKDLHLDKYGRALARVEVDGQDLSAALLAAGLARPYHGEKREPWCTDR